MGKCLYIGKGPRAFLPWCCCLKNGSSARKIWVTSRQIANIWKQHISNYIISEYFKCQGDFISRHPNTSLFSINSILVTNVRSRNSLKLSWDHSFTSETSPVAVCINSLYLHISYKHQKIWKYIWKYLNVLQTKCKDPHIRFHKKCHGFIAIFILFKYIFVLLLWESEYLLNWDPFTQMS